MAVDTAGMEQCLACGASFPYGHIHTCAKADSYPISDIVYPYDPNADLITAIQNLTDAIERLIKKSNGHKPE